MRSDSSGRNDEGVAGKEIRGRAVIALVDGATREEQQALLQWAHELTAIRQSSLPKVKQLREAISVTRQAHNEVIWPLVRRHETCSMGRKKLGNETRCATPLLAAVFGAKGAGIAALGKALGVPVAFLWTYPDSVLGRIPPGNRKVEPAAFACSATILPV